MRFVFAAGALGALALVAGCPKQPGTPAAAAGRGNLTLRVDWPAPLLCSRWTKHESDTALHVADPTGCNAAVRFRLAPSGLRDLELPFFRDAPDSFASERAEGERVVDRTIRLRDPAGEDVWAVELPASSLPTGDGCADPSAADQTSVDLRPWRLLVVSVVTVDQYGTERPIATTQEDTLKLTITPAGGAPFSPAIVRSTTHDAVWAAAWCAARTPSQAELTVRASGAAQARDDTFALPPARGEVYTTLAYRVEPEKQ